MTDNVTANPSTGGSVFATDFHSSESAHWPITKMAWGTRDTNYTIVDLTNALPVQPGTGAIWNIQGGNTTSVKVDGSAVTQPISGSVSVTGSVAVTGTFWQATQPISAVSLPLPSGAATSANQPAINGDGGALAHITNFPATQAISAASLPLPANASQDGVDGTGITAPTGGSGIRGWLSGIYQKISGTLTVSFVSSNTDGSSTITTGGTAQNLFGGTTPTNGYAVYGCDAANDVWINEGGTAVVNGTGSILISANGGGYETPPGYKPSGVVSVISATTGAKFTAKRW